MWYKIATSVQWELRHRNNEGGGMKRFLSMLGLSATLTATATLTANAPRGTG